MILALSQGETRQTLRLRMGEYKAVTSVDALTLDRPLLPPNDNSTASVLPSGTLLTLSLTVSKRSWFPIHEENPRTLVNNLLTFPSSVNKFIMTGATQPQRRRDLSPFKGNFSTMVPNIPLH